MAAMDFPSSPTNGQVYGNYVYNTAKGAWQANPVTSEVAVISPTAPSNPKAGDIWYNSDDGCTYVYYYDGDSYQWVASRNDATFSSTLGPRVDALENGAVNYIINGAMDIWQRGTSIAANNQTVWTADRWIIQTGSTTTTSRQSTGLEGFQYCARIQRNSGVTSTSSLSLGQPLETIMSIPLAGKTVTLSWYARAGANFSAASSILSMALITGTGTDQNRLISGYTGETVVTNASYTLTTSWKRFSVTVTLPSNTNEITVNPYYVPTGTAGAADYYEITGVQLQAGSVATAFRRNADSIQGELAACQRYYQRVVSQGAYGIVASGWAYTSVSATLWQNFKVTMRVSPTSIEYSGLTVHDNFTSYGTVSNIILVPDLGNANAGNVTATSSSLVGGRPLWLGGNVNTAAYLAFSAEL